MKFIKSFLIALLTFSQSALALDSLGKFKDWNIFRDNRDNQIICYAISTPIKHSGDFEKKGEPFLMVTNVINDADEVNVSSGVEYNKKSDVELSFEAKNLVTTAQIINKRSQRGFLVSMVEAKEHTAGKERGTGL